MGLFRKSASGTIPIKKNKLSPTQIIPLVFLGIILLGAALLSLPMAARSGKSCGFIPALFTATSATCVTGLSLFDTYTQWSGFGQAVILCLIEIGGLGFMSAASLIVFLLKKKVGLRQRMIIAQALSLNEMEGVVRLQKWVLKGSLLIQGLGMVILTLRFLPEYGLRQSVIWGVFHSVSAFCNAGFDIFGSVQPDSSISLFAGDPVVCITLMALIVIGGLGFFVWEEVITVRKFKKFSVYTKLVLITTGVLLLGFTLAYMALEWNNPQTIGNMPVWQKVLNSLFQSVTIRTAGFFSFSQGGMTEGAKAVSVLGMLIGGSAGSTAGGIKTVTFLLLILSLVCRARGKSTVNIFKRTIPESKITDAMTIASLMIGLTFLGAVVITVTSPVSFTDALFEASSALATVGLTAGITTGLSLVSKLLIIVFMFFGRVGILTISLGFLMGDRAEQRYHYAGTNILIG